MPATKLNLAYRGTHHIKLAIQMVLRAIFASDLVDERFRYVYAPNDKDEEGNEKKIYIYRAFPQRLLGYPALIISSGGFDPSLQATGEYQEDAGEIPNNGEDTSTYTGAVKIPITINIYAKSIDDREELTDILVVIFRVLCRDRFADKGIGYVTLSVGGEGQETDSNDGKLIYTNSLTIQVNTDYTLFVTPEQTDIIDSIFTRVWASRSNLPSVELTNNVPDLSNPSGYNGPYRTEPTDPDS